MHGMRRAVTTVEGEMSIMFRMEHVSIVADAASSDIHNVSHPYALKSMFCTEFLSMRILISRHCAGLRRQRSLGKPQRAVAGEAEARSQPKWPLQRSPQGSEV